MTRLATISEVLKKHNNAVFTVLRANGEEVFMRPLSASQVHEGLDKNLLGCAVSEISIEDFLGVEFITATLRY